MYFVQQTINKVLEIASYRITFGQFTFSFFELWLAQFGLLIGAYVFWRLLDGDSE